MLFKWINDFDNFMSFKHSGLSYSVSLVFNMETFTKNGKLVIIFKLYGVIDVNSSEQFVFLAGSIFVTSVYCLSEP